MALSADTVQLLHQAAAARRAIRAGADPLLTLSYIVWPTDRITETILHRRSR